MRSFTYFQSELGPITIIQEEGFITALSFEPPAKDLPRSDSHSVLQLATAWLRDYFAGSAPDPDTLPIRLQGTPFQLSVWKILRTVPYGQTVTYKQIAHQLGPRMSAQAVGGAVGRNPISIIVPCHRVIGAGGNLTGYAWGLHRKQFLLELEGALTSSADR